uniref:Uncharacterized protein n=1 Tax=Lygus hesperus TaxID=30085 RepID=A0A146M545_LYGHE
MFSQYTRRSSSTPTHRLATRPRPTPQALRTTTAPSTAPTTTRPLQRSEAFLDWIPKNHFVAAENNPHKTPVNRYLGVCLPNNNLNLVTTLCATYLQKQVGEFPLAKQTR